MKRKRSEEQCGLSHAAVFGPDFHAEVERQAQNIGHVFDIVQTSLSSIGVPHVVAAYTDIIIDAEKGKSTPASENVKLTSVPLLSVAKKWGHNVIRDNEWYDLPTTVCRSLRGLALKFDLAEVTPVFNAAFIHKATEKQRQFQHLEMCHVKAVLQHFDSGPRLKPIKTTEVLPRDIRENYEMNKSGFLQLSLLGKRKAAQEAAFLCRRQLSSLNSRLLELAKKCAPPEILVQMTTKLSGPIDTGSIFSSTSLFQHAVVLFQQDGELWHMAIKLIDIGEIILINISEAGLPRWLTVADTCKCFTVKQLPGKNIIDSLLYYVEVFLSRPLKFIENLWENRSPDHGIEITDDAASESQPARDSDGASATERNTRGGAGSPQGKRRKNPRARKEEAKTCAGQGMSKCSRLFY